MNARTLARLVPFGLLCACSAQSAKLPPTGQVLLYVTTDAPLPPASSEPPLGPNEPPALFDRLRVEVFAPGTTAPCESCSREFELDRLRVRAGQASFGIVPQAGVTGYVARVRLYRAISVVGGQPPPLSTIDVYAALPVVAAEGIVKASVVLRVDDVGRTLGKLDAPTPTQPGEPDLSMVGTWPKAARVPCAGKPGADEACVPGGAFWLGHPYAGLYEDGSDASASRVVVVSPFYVDLHEVTVAEYRASGLATLDKTGTSSVDPSVGAAASPPPPPAVALTPDNPQYFCTYSDAPLGDKNSRENLPVTCVSWTAASAFCAARGKKLPSEAEYEYMASNLRSDLYVWGQEPAACGESVWGRAGFGVFAGYGECRPPGDPAGPLSAGQGKLDRLVLEQGEVLDLAGNVSEWTRDTWNRANEPCWVGKALLENPECSAGSPADGDRRTIKGGPWVGYVPPAAFRIGRPPGAANRPQTGFRCIRPAR